MNLLENVLFIIGQYLSKFMKFSSMLDHNKRAVFDSGIKPHSEEELLEIADEVDEISKQIEFMKQKENDSSEIEHIFDRSKDSKEVSDNHEDRKNEISFTIYPELDPAAVIALKVMMDLSTSFSTKVKIYNYLLKYQMDFISCKNCLLYTEQENEPNSQCEFCFRKTILMDNKVTKEFFTGEQNDKN